jgi:hypothetical protein
MIKETNQEVTAPNILTNSMTQFDYTTLTSLAAAAAVTVAADCTTMMNMINDNNNNSSLNNRRNPSSTPMTSTVTPQSHCRENVSSPWNDETFATCVTTALVTSSGLNNSSTSPPRKIYNAVSTSITATATATQNKQQLLTKAHQLNYQDISMEEKIQIGEQLYALRTEQLKRKEFLAEQQLKHQDISKKDKTQLGKQLLAIRAEQLKHKELLRAEQLKHKDVPIKDKMQLCNAQVAAKQKSGIFIQTDRKIIGKPIVDPPPPVAFIFIPTPLNCKSKSLHDINNSSVNHFALTSAIEDCTQPQIPMLRSTLGDNNDDTSTVSNPIYYKCIRYDEIPAFRVSVINEGDFDSAIHTFNTIYKCTTQPRCRLVYKRKSGSRQCGSNKPQREYYCSCCKVSSCNLISLRFVNTEQQDPISLRYIFIVVAKRHFLQETILHFQK